MLFHFVLLEIIFVVAECSTDVDSAKAAKCPSTICRMSPCPAQNVKQINKTLATLNFKMSTACGRKYAFVLKKNNALQGYDQCCVFGDKWRSLNLELPEYLDCLLQAFRKKFNTSEEFYVHASDFTCPGVMRWCAAKTVIASNLWLPGFLKSNIGSCATVQLHLTKPSGLIKVSCFREKLLICEEIPTSTVADTTTTAAYTTSDSVSSTSEASVDVTSLKTTSVDTLPPQTSATTNVLSETTSTALISASTLTEIQSSVSTMDVETTTSNNVTTTEVVIVPPVTHREPNTKSAAATTKALCGNAACHPYTCSTGSKGIKGRKNLVEGTACGRNYIFLLKQSSAYDIPTQCCEFGDKWRGINLDSLNHITCLQRVFLAHFTEPKTILIRASDMTCADTYRSCETRSIIGSKFWQKGQPNSATGDCVVIDLKVNQQMVPKLKTVSCFTRKFVTACEEVQTETLNMDSIETSESVENSVTSNQVLTTTKPSVNLAVLSEMKTTNKCPSCNTICSTSCDANTNFDGVIKARNDRVISTACGKRYIFLLKKLAANDAIAQCCEYGKTFRGINIDSQFALACLEGAFKAYSIYNTAEFFVQATNVGSTGTFQWCDAKFKVSPDLWASGYPKTTANASCVVISLYLTKQKSQMRNVQCDEKQFYICEELKK